MTLWLATEGHPGGRLGECADWFPLYDAAAAFGAMGVSVKPWELAERAECWGQWAIDYITAVRQAPIMREQINQARAKGQRALPS